MWERIKAFILHFFGNIIKLFILFLVLFLLFTLTPHQVSSEPAIGILFIFLFATDVVTVYDFDNFIVVVTETGGGLLTAFLVYFLAVSFIIFLLEHAAIVAGILLVLYAINRGTEVWKYYDDLPKFFMVTGALFALTVLANAICFFIGGPTAIPIVLAVIDFLMLVVEVINIIARATQADCPDWAY